MKFKYKQKVIVISGFFEGHPGIVVAYQPGYERKRQGWKTTHTEKEPNYYWVLIDGDGESRPFQETELA